MLNLKNFLGKKNNPEEAEQTQQNLDLEPASEEPKKVNRLLIGSIVAALAGVLSFAIFSGGDDATVSSKKNNDSSSVNTASMTSEQLKNLEESKTPKTQDPNKPQIDEHDHDHDHNHDDVDMHDHDHEHVHNHGDVHASGQSNQNVSVGNTQAPAPIVLSDEEREAKEDAKEARSEYKAKVKSRAKEDLEGSRSAIFFPLKQEKKEAPTETTKSVENANDYYNNYSKDNYISVVK